ncbi:MAG: YhcH/YjgK/YiaL family protein [Melioribacteraceae bacterium]|nr:YhcH/YjgK/YiaL family protein [Melioribacteraceae bacterium]MCF8266396.1 YhcH/YjgK/YiaL family protein [Melioribacteraceae bacterium]MCF8413241.1 YhcH/YjgK/YiaL family protein [Melioribacteraceae bacterium]MCF8432745.1 YhcH/YjgK/YiaL family protein [Melioribacteraceae bacterium]
MIFDSIENAEIYYGLGERFETAFEYLKNCDFNSLPLEKVEIDGENIFALPQKYITKNDDEARWESHRKYVDIQYMASGSENMGYVLEDYLDQTDEYDDARDVEFFDGEGDYLQLNGGEFVVFFPDDAHKPGLKIEEKEEVFKVVIKVRI